LIRKQQPLEEKPIIHGQKGVGHRGWIDGAQFAAIHPFLHDITQQERRAR